MSFGIWKSPWELLVDAALERLSQESINAMSTIADLTTLQSNTEAAVAALGVALTASTGEIATVQTDLAQAVSDFQAQIANLQAAQPALDLSVGTAALATLTASVATLSTANATLTSLATQITAADPGKPAAAAPVTASAPAHVPGAIGH